MKSWTNRRPGIRCLNKVGKFISSVKEQCRNSAHTDKRGQHESLPFSAGTWSLCREVVTAVLPSLVFGFWIYFTWMSKEFLGQEIKVSSLKSLAEDDTKCVFWKDIFKSRGRYRVGFKKNSEHRKGDCVSKSE